MANLFRTSPEKQLAHDIDAATQNRDKLAAKLFDSEHAIVQHTTTARKLAVEGDDAGLDRAESALRAAQDRRSTLQAAIADVERQLAALEQTKVDNADRKQRDETAAATELLAREVIDAAAAFDAAAAVLAGCTARAAPIVPEATGVQNFALITRVEIPAASGMIAALLRGHAAAVLDGTAPAALPSPEAPFVEPAIEKPPTVRLFCMRAVKWTAADGTQRMAQRYQDADLPPSAASRGLASGALVPLDSPLRKQHHGTWPGHVRADICTDLDADVPAQGSVDPIDAAFTPIDRGPVIVGRIPRKAGL